MTVVGLCLLAMLIDGYDVFMFGIALPVIARSFAVLPAALTGIVFAQNAGLVLGALVMGPLSDRYGRKPVLIVCVIAFGVLTLTAAQAQSLSQMAALRLTAAIFFSGVVPNAVALVGEMAPLRYRSGLVALTFCGYAGGTALGGLVNGPLLAAHGWPVIFVIGGALPLLLAIPLMIWLPESLRFRARRDPRDPRIAALLQRMDPALRLEESRSLSVIEAPSGERGGSSVRALFATKRRSLTILLWLSFALSLASVTTMAAWSTTVLTEGFALPIARAGLLIGVLASAGLVGTATSGFIMDRFGAGPTLLGFYAGCTLLMLSPAFVDYHGPSGYLSMALLGYCVNSAQGALNAFSAGAYPTPIRATGVGWAFGAGRVGGLLGPVIGGAMISAGHADAAFFSALALPFAIVAVFVPAMTKAHRSTLTE